MKIRKFLIKKDTLEEIIRILLLGFLTLAFFLPHILFSPEGQSLSIIGSICALSLFCIFAQWIVRPKLKITGRILFIFAAIAVSCILFMIIARFVNSVPGYMVLGNMLILFMTIAGGGIIPIMYLPEGVLTIARFTPTYWFIKLILTAGV